MCHSFFYVKITIKSISLPTLIANYFLYYVGLLVICHSSYGIGSWLVDTNKDHNFYILEGLILGMISMATSEAVVNGKKISSKR